MPYFWITDRDNLGQGELTNAFRMRTEAVVVEADSTQFESDPDADTLTPVGGRPNPFSNGTRLYAQPVPGHANPGLNGRIWYVVGVQGESIFVSDTPGGNVRDLTAVGRVAFSTLVADYMQGTGNPVLWGFKTDVQMTQEQRRLLRDTIEQMLTEFQFENLGPDQ